MLSEKSSPPGKSGIPVVNRLISGRELRAVDIKHLVELSVEHECFCHFFSKRKTCHVRPLLGSIKGGLTSGILLYVLILPRVLKGHTPKCGQ